MAELKTMRKSIDKVVEDNEVQKDVSSFLYMMSENTLNDKSEKDERNEMVRKLFKEGFEIHDPKKTMKIGSKVIQQAMWRFMSKAKFLDSMIHGTGKSENVERIVTEGFMTIVSRGQLPTVFSGKMGALFNAGMYGDGYIGMGKGDSKEIPLKYQTFQNEDVYFDNYCTGIRGVRPSNRLVTVQKYDKETAYEMWPDLEEEEIYGRIPGTYEGTDRLSDRDDSDILEVAWAYNLAKKQHIRFAGAQAFKLDKWEGEEYPFMKHGDPFIPVFQFLCMPSEDGPTNYGIGEMVYDLAIITRKLLNMEVGHIEENTYPITLINAPQSKVDELVEKMAMANKARANGKKPFVAMEFDKVGGNQGVGAQSLLTQNLFNEWNVIWDRLYRELARLGINLDDVDRGSGITRGQVIAEEQASNAFVQQMMEYNASETKELIECSLEGIKEFVSATNKTPLNLMTRIRLGDGSSARINQEVTMGMLKKTLMDGNWFVKTDDRSGTIPSDLTKLIHEETMIAMTPPGTPQYNELYRRIGMRRGIEVELSPQEPVETPSTPDAPDVEPGEEAVPTPAATQRIVPAALGTVETPV